MRPPYRRWASISWTGQPYRQLSTRAFGRANPRQAASASSGPAADARTIRPRDPALRRLQRPRFAQLTTTHMNHTRHGHHRETRLRGGRLADDTSVGYYHL